MQQKPNSRALLASLTNIVKREPTSLELLKASALVSHQNYTWAQAISVTAKVNVITVTPSQANTQTETTVMEAAA